MPGPQPVDRRYCAAVECGELGLAARVPAVGVRDRLGEQREAPLELGALVPDEIVAVGSHRRQVSASGPLHTTAGTTVPPAGFPRQSPLSARMMSRPWRHSVSGAGRRAAHGARHLGFPRSPPMGRRCGCATCWCPASPRRPARGGARGHVRGRARQRRAHRRAPVSQARRAEVRAAWHPVPARRDTGPSRELVQSVEARFAAALGGG
jgi:hypothetical protein